jgi:hypothetical protein
MRINLGQAGAFDSTAKVVDFPRAKLGAAGVRDVERINPFDYFELARKLAALNRFDTNAPIDASAAFWTAYGGRNSVEEMLAGKPVELGVCRAKAQVLHQALNHLITNRFTEMDADGKAQWKLPAVGAEPLNGWEWSSIKDGVEKFELVFAEEMREAATYRVPERGIYNTRRLIDDADLAFPKEVVGFVPPKSKLEWKAAGRCMAFGMFTACGFHVARAVEGTLEAYHHRFCAKTDDKNRQWGEYLSDLEKVKTIPAPDPKSLGELRQLKDDWRNPLMHPRVVLEEADARAVFNNGETLIMMMTQELVATAAAGVQPPLGLVETTAGETKAIGQG